MADPSDEKHGGDAEKSGTSFKSVMASIADWKVLVTVIAAGTSWWFSVTEQYNKDLKVNQAAIEFASGENMMARFWVDPPNTINQIETSYPRHAFCSVLGYYVAEVARSQRSFNAPQGQATIHTDAIKEADDAVSAEIEQIADNHKVDLCVLEETAFATGDNLVPLDSLGTVRDAASGGGGARCQAAEPLDYCTAVHAEPGLWVRQWRDTECTLAMNAYAENICTGRVAERRAVLVQERERKAELAQLAAIREDEVRKLRQAQMMANATPDRASGEGGASGSGSGAPDTALEGPVRRCGGASPTIYLQAKIDGADQGARVQSIEAIRAALIKARWRVTVLDKVDAAPTRGDVRYYYEDQKACATALARDAAAARGDGVVQLPVTSLVGAYKSLPRGRMELWLP